MQGGETRRWYEDAFGTGYLRVYPHRDLAAARAEIAGLLERGVAGRVLDLGCGFGRHCLALVEAGLDAFGLDLSRELLLRSRGLPGGRALGGRLACGDFRSLPFAAGAFDTVLMLFSSFGYFDDASNARVLDEVARVLSPGGRAVLDLMNPERIRATLVPESRRSGQGFVLEEHRRLEQWGRRVVKDVRLVDEREGESRWHEDVRLYGPAELVALLAPRGLVPERTDGDFDGSAFGPDSPRQIVWISAARPR